MSEAAESADEMSGDAYVDADAGDAPSKHPGVRHGEEPTVTVTQPTPEAEKKKRQARPYWILLPVKGSTLFEVHCVVGKPAVLKLLKKLEIDATDPRIDTMKVLRAEEVTLKRQQQTVLKFGKVEEDDVADEDDEVI